MTSEAFVIWRQYIECNLSTLAYKYNIAAGYGTPKEACIKNAHLYASLMYKTIKCLDFYTEAEQEADSTLTTGDKTECLTHDELMIILYDIKRLIQSCG